MRKYYRLCYGFWQNHYNSHHFLHKSLTGEGSFKHLTATQLVLSAQWLLLLRLYLHSRVQSELTRCGTQSPHAVWLPVPLQHVSATAARGSWLVRGFPCTAAAAAPVCMVEKIKKNKGWSSGMGVPQFSYVGVWHRCRGKREGRGIEAGLLYIGKCTFRCPIEKKHVRCGFPSLKTSDHN